MHSWSCTVRCTGKDNMEKPCARAHGCVPYMLCVPLLSLCRLDESHMTGEAEDVVKSVSTGKTLMLAGSKVRLYHAHMGVHACAYCASMHAFRSATHQPCTGC